MFNNLLNVHDFIDVMRDSSKALLRLTPGLLLNKEDRVKVAWEHTSAPPRNWWDIPAVRERWNRLISGDTALDYYEYISRKYLSNNNSLHALSLGCGTGHREIRWAELGSFANIDAYDLSEKRIEIAVENAREKGLDTIINFKAGSVDDISMLENHYDVVLGEQSLHHFTPLKDILLRINRFLKPGGYFFVNEYVGPIRFQWAEKQLSAANELLAALPDAYKVIWNSNAVKRKVYAPGRLRMFLSDPSEAVESSRIMPLLGEIFDMVEIRDYGGTVLHLLFKDIAHHFMDDNQETGRLLEYCFEYEDKLLRNKELTSDFIVAVYRKRE
ncbi:class I SAM-dependent methyltransferase [Candidatus Latescibacterota bacterium]